MREVVLVHQEYASLTLEERQKLSTEYKDNLSLVHTVYERPIVFPDFFDQIVEDFEQGWLTSGPEFNENLRILFTTAKDLLDNSHRYILNSYYHNLFITIKIIVIYRDEYLLRIMKFLLQNFEDKKLQFTLTGLEEFINQNIVDKLM